ncbi:MAG: hypothetical protein JSS94_05900 [Bacteroidetes bacterium]|nr:hypothetical protein [Bacteroidota bacterium]
MKKLMFLAALVVAGMVSANSLKKVDLIELNSETSTNYFTNSKVLSGICYIRIYRDNHDGTFTLVLSEDVPMESKEDCVKLNKQKVKYAFDNQL